MSRNHSPDRAKILGPVLAVVAALGLGADAATVPTIGEDQLASIVRGGRLYDNWFEETRVETRVRRHPAYPAAAPGAPADTWRCAECHGWDYRGADGAFSRGEHYTGIKGIRALAGADPQRVIAVMRDETHGYTDTMLGPRDFADLAAFVTRGQVDMVRSIDRATGKAKGDATRNADFYKIVCANCHGRSGLKLRTMAPLGKIARDNPWETLHKILNGHPNERMPALRVVGVGVLADILATVQTLPEEDRLITVVRGGRLYDNWHTETQSPPPRTRHPAYPAVTAYAYEPGTTWRCKECHGWDYRGADGAYSKGPHATGTKGIRAQAGADPERVVAVLKDDTHGYARVLGEGDLRDLAIFVVEGQVDMDWYIDRATKKAKGDAGGSAAYYKTICATCHGIDGQRMRTMPALGRVARSNPWEALHKILNGHPDESMPALRVLDPTTLADILAYTQTLPAR